MILPPYDPESADERDALLRKLLELDAKNKHTYYASYEKGKEEPTKDDGQSQPEAEKKRMFTGFGKVFGNFFRKWSSLIINLKMDKKFAHL